MFAAMTIALALLGPTDLSTPVPADPGERPGMRCWAAAKGRTTVPVRENFMTFSPVIDTLAKGRVIWGERVEGENKVLVHTPNTLRFYGIARHTFLREVDAGECRGPKLHAPSLDMLLTWVGSIDDGLPGARPPSVFHSTVGCYVLKKGVVLRGGKGEGPLSVAVDQPFFGGSSPVGSRYPATIELLNAESGGVETTVKLGQVIRVPFSRCGGADVVKAVR